MSSEILGIGLCGKSLTDLERRILRETSPYAVVLFGRNVDTAEQLTELVREVKSISKRPPLFMIDEEGGRVDRLRNIIPGLPSVQSFSEGQKPREMSQWLGRVIGMALRYFDIEIDLAPVVDIRSDDAPKGLERRTFGNDPESVVELAGAFIEGLHANGVASCLKHWPGIGVGSADPHYGATIIDVPLEQLLARDLVPFAKLGKVAGAIMIGHGTYPQIDNPDMPASLSRKLTADLLRQIGFDGVSDLGSYEVISELALKAGNDVILFCSHIERFPDIEKYLASRVRENSAVRARFEDARARAERYRAHCERIRKAGAPPASLFKQLVDETVKFCDEFQATIPEGEV